MDRKTRLNAHVGDGFSGDRGQFQFGYSREKSQVTGNGTFQQIWIII